MKLRPWLEESGTHKPEQGMCNWSLPNLNNDLVDLAPDLTVAEHYASISSAGLVLVRPDAVFCNAWVWCWQ